VRTGVEGFTGDDFVRRQKEADSILILGADRSLMGGLTHFLGDQSSLVSATFEDLSFDLRPGVADVREGISGRDLDSFGLVVFRSLHKSASVLGAMVSYLKFRSLPFVGQHVTRICVPNKLFQYTSFAHHGLPFPRSIYLSHGQLNSSYDLLRRQLGSPFVLKSIETSGGRHNFLVADEPAFVRVAGGTGDDSPKLIAQKYIYNADIADLRILIFGGEVVLVMRRASQNGSHITNTSAGGKATLLDPAAVDPEAMALAMSAALALEYDIAGLDIIQSSITGEWSILEVNSTPAISTGAFPEEKIAAYTSYLRRKLAD
jgi:glutathione synthase/RimK-type ligase-like ATP-grasp enzyme